MKLFTFQLRREGRVNNVTDVVKRGQKVKVKCLSFTGQKVALSMKVIEFHVFLATQNLGVFFVGNTGLWYKIELF